MPAKLSRTTRMPYGMTNAAARQTMGNSGVADPTWARMIALEYINNNDTTALTENGSATVTLAAGVGGSATLTTGAVANTLGAAATAQAVFQVPTTANNLGRMFFKWQGSIDSLVGTLQVGFVASAASSPQGIYIQSAVTTGALSLIVKNGSGTTTVPFPTSLALVAGTTVELGLEVDTLGNVFAFFNPTTGAEPITGTVPSTPIGTVANGPVVAAYNQLNGALTGLFLPTAALYASQGAIPTTAVARVVTVNFFVALQEVTPN
jgi:hypothetical protein